MLIIKAYFLTVITTMISEMWVVARADIIGLPRNQCQTLCTIFSSFLPLGNVIVLLANVKLIFMKRNDFITAYLYAKLDVDGIRDEVNRKEKDEEE